MEKNKDVKILLVLLVFSEAYFNLHIIFNNYDLLYSNYINGRYSEKVESLNYIKNDNSLFYRTEFYDTEEISDNNSFYYNFNSASVWLSTLNMDLTFFEHTGYGYGNNRYEYYSYPVLNSVFGIKYYESKEENSLYNKKYTHLISAYDNKLFGIDSIESIIYENPYALSLGYMVNKSDENSLDGSNYYEVQNDLMNDMNNLNLNIYEKQNIIKKDDKYYVTIDTTDDLYLSDYLETKEDKYYYDVYINDVFYDRISKGYVNTLYIKNDYNIGDILEISFMPSSSNINFKDVILYSFNKENFEANIDYLKQNQLVVTEFKDGSVKGNINVKKDGTLFTTIPYESGWEVYVDGIKTNIYPVYNTFVGFNLSSGYHEIEFVYTTPGLKFGIIVSISSLILFISYQIWEKKKNSSN